MTDWTKFYPSIILVQKYNFIELKLVFTPSNFHSSLRKVRCGQSSFKNDIILLLLWRCMHIFQGYIKQQRIKEFNQNWQYCILFMLVCTETNNVTVKFITDKRFTFSHFCFLFFNFYPIYYKPLLLAALCWGVLAASSSLF